jgi:signal transduction histidine kinase
VAELDEFSKRSEKLKEQNVREAWEHLITGNFLPHGHCYLWLPEILWTHVLSDTLTALSYYSIPIAIVFFMRKRPDVRFPSVGILFSTFIFLCGTTHLVAIWVVWNGHYGIQGMVKAATAIVSAFTAVYIWRLMPVLLSIPSKVQLEQRVSDATNTLERRNDELRQANIEIEDFVSVASHDLKEPLRTLTSFSQLLEKDLGPDLPAAARTDLQHIKEASARMNALVRDLLDLSKASRKSLSIETVSLDACLDEALHMLTVRLRDSQAKIDRSTLPTLTTDKVLVTQILQNLISNAVKFTRNGSMPSIRVSAEKIQEDEYVISVADSGIGIPEQARESIFEPFERLKGRNEYEGTGIGLAICRRAIGRLGGNIWVEESDDGGAKFKFVVRSVANRTGDNQIPIKAPASPCPAG